MKTQTLKERMAALAAAPLPDRLNEQWRFGRPHVYAQEMAQILESFEVLGEVNEELAQIQSIGSDALLNLALARLGTKIQCLELTESSEEQITLSKECSGNKLSALIIKVQAGVKAHLVERNEHQEHVSALSLRLIILEEGAELKYELQEKGNGTTKLMNITHIQAKSAKLRHLTRYENCAWAREELTAEILSSENNCELELYSANRLTGNQVLDQHTRQIHRCGKGMSTLLYKNVLDDAATATFAGNIFVAPGAHDTDAYQANRNMMLSEDATLNSLPGLEILADKVRCSHGSATSPMNAEELFYLCSRGIPTYEAQKLVAEGFLEDALTRFNRES